MPLKTSTSLRYATPVGNDLMCSVMFTLMVFRCVMKMFVFVYSRLLMKFIRYNLCFCLDSMLFSFQLLPV